MVELSHNRHFYEIGLIKLYVTLFLSAFLAATIFPAQSETLLAYQISQNPNAAVALVGVATLGNVLGSVVNWVLGRFATKNGQKVIPSEQGRYHDYYEAFAEAVKTGGDPPRYGSSWGTYACGLGCGTSKCAGRA